MPKKTIDINSEKAGNFWFGVALGMTASAGALYLIGTTKGRKSLKKVIDFAENANVEEYIEGLIDQFGDTAHEVEKKVEVFEGKVIEQAQHNPLHGLIEKIQSFTYDSKGKKTFVKE